MMRSFINGQIWLSRHFDKLLSEKFRLDGNRDFVKLLVPKYLKNNMIIFDVGGGKNPYLSVETKRKLNATVIGLDIDGDELKKAPIDGYDEIICANISEFRGAQNADMVICQAVLEHVVDVEGAFMAISSILKPGGRALIFVPSRNALFARLNIMLPQKFKRAILHTIYPSTARSQGFPSYYNKCTPLEFKELAEENNFSVVEQRYYYVSSYFSFFFPIFLLWRVWILLFYTISRENAAETFSLVLEKDGYSIDRI